MIDYEPGTYHIKFVFQRKGSLIPRAFVMALPSVVLSMLLQFFKGSERYPQGLIDTIQELNNSSVWNCFTAVVFMLVAFRCNHAYRRFWEGITLLQQMRAEWFEACSNLIAFTRVGLKQHQDNPEYRNKVKEFSHILVRLMSLMHASALWQISGCEEEFDCLDLDGVDSATLDFLWHCDSCHLNRAEVVLHWIQELITECIGDVLAVPPPILTRAFQTLSRGMVNLHNARKLADVPFPFALSQASVALLIVSGVGVPVYFSSIVSNALIAGILTAIPLMGMWCIIFICGNLEQPFGTDPDDLPLIALQHDMNLSLLTLLDARQQKPPTLAGKAMNIDEMLEELGEDGVKLSKTKRLQARKTSSPGSGGHDIHGMKRYDSFLPPPGSISRFTSSPIIGRRDPCPTWEAFRIRIFEKSK